MLQIAIYQGLEYLLDNVNKQATVKAPTAGISGLLIIPAHIFTENGMYEVTEIGSNAFFNYQRLTGIILPRTLKTIREYAFQSSSLVSVAREKSEKTLIIERSAFEMCKDLQSIEFNGPAVLSAPRIFYGCNKMQQMDSFHIQGEVTSECFHNCKKLTDFHFDGIVDIAQDAFSGVCLKRAFILSDVLDSNETSFLEAIKNANIFCGPKCKMLNLAYEGFHIHC